MNKEKRVKHLKEVELLRKSLERNVTLLSMEDWNLKVSYAPEETPEDTNTLAEIDVEAPNKSAKIKFYTMEDYDKVMFHELLHCQVGMLTKLYNTALDSYNEIIKDLIQKNEEVLIEKLQWVMGVGQRKK